MKLIFLDIDGVLAPHGRPNPDVWCAETCARLKCLVDATGAKVVLVSSWPLEDARMMLAAHDIEIHDAIAERDRRGGLGRYGLTAREAGIVDYLNKRKSSCWVWLDDFGTLQDATELRSAGNGRVECVRTTNPLLCGYIETNWFYDDGDDLGHGFDDATYARALRILEVT